MAISKNKALYWLVGYADENKPDAIIYCDGHPLMVGHGGDITSCTGGYETKEQLINQCEIQDFPCSVCGGVVSTSYTCRDEMIKRKLCFDCWHWTTRLASISADDHIIDGAIYRVGPEPAPGTAGSLCGMGGREFHIQRLDFSKQIVTHNLWGGGAIPHRFRIFAPDNAIFLNGARRVQVGHHVYYDSSEPITKK